MKGFGPLDNRNREEVVALLSERPETNIILLSNIHKYGMNPGITPFHGEYFGKRGNSGLEAAGALFNLGSLFFHAVDDEVLGGLAGYILGLGSFPRFLNGPAAQVGRLVESLFPGGGRSPVIQDAVLMVLRGPSEGYCCETGARCARAEDVDEMLEMGRLFEEELFGGGIEDDSSLRELIALQVEQGAATVVESGGALISKAEATVLDGVGAHVGGVYTRREYRGEGHSSRCVADLCARLLAACPLVSLIVHNDNYPAIAVYRKIGFAKVEDWKIATAPA